MTAWCVANFSLTLPPPTGNGSEQTQAAPRDPAKDVSTSTSLQLLHASLLFILPEEPGPHVMKIWPCH